MCAPHNEAWEQIHGVPKGIMDMGLYRTIIASLAAEGICFDHIIFQWLGDPSLHPQLPEMLRIAGEQLGEQVGYLRVDTNGIRLPPKRMDEIVAAATFDVPLLVVFTIDAHTKPTYKQVKGQDALGQVRRNIRHLIRRRAATGVAINIQLQFVVQEANAHEAGEFLAYWSELLGCQGGEQWHDELMFKRLSVGGGAEGQEAADHLYDKTIKDFGIKAGRVGGVVVGLWRERPWQADDGHDSGRTACPGLWLTPVIRHDGALMMCCADLGGELTLGSLADHSFETLWNGELATRRRMAHLEGRFEGVCAGCGGINWYKTTDVMAAAAHERAAALGLV
jgi:MoaA/NifB/PqqE/SkfB family radical SAM enzyme